MPAAWSTKDERMYRHIVQSCTKGRKKRPKTVCKRIAASTVNKLRRREGRTLGDFVLFASPKPGHPDTEGWTPGWVQTCDRFNSRAEAEAAIARYGRSGARYRIQKSSKPSPSACR